MPANQSLEVFRNEYAASEYKGVITRPNLSDWDYEGAKFKCGIDYKAELRYEGTKSGKDYYVVQITYPKDDGVRTIKKRLIYEGAGVEVFRDDRYRICIRPRIDKQAREQDGVSQPATAPDSKSKGDQKPDPESNERSQ